MRTKTFRKSLKRKKIYNINNNNIIISGRSNISDKGEPGHTHPEKRGRGGGKLGLKKKFLALQSSVWPQNKEGAHAPRAPLLDPPLITIIAITILLLLLIMMMMI